MYKVNNEDYDDYDYGGDEYIFVFDNDVYNIDNEWLPSAAAKSRTSSNFLQFIFPSSLAAHSGSLALKWSLIMVGY